MRSARLAALIIPISLLITLPLRASEAKGPAAFLAVQRDQDTTAMTLPDFWNDRPVTAAGIR